MNKQTVTRAKTLRLRLGVTLDTLAAETGLPRAYLSESERGIRNLSAAQQERIEGALARLAAGQDVEAGARVTGSKEGRAGKPRITPRRISAVIER